MTLFKRLAPLVLLLLTLGLAPLPTLGATGVAEDWGTTDTATIALDEPLLFDPQIRSGRLPNGLEYFVREHPFPEDTIVLRLIVDAGSIQEENNQKGLAHFVEHMAFNGTEEFGETELVAYLERLGMSFGPDVNAYTSFDETVYKLTVPTGDPEAVSTAFRVMEQWAQAILMDPEAIDRERGVIVEEWRRGQSASQRMLRTHIPVLLKGSRYAERLPIGDMEIVRNAPPEEFTAFYRRWYRPDNMAFIVVGDLPAQQLETLVRRELGGLRQAERALERPYASVTLQEDTRVSIATDPEATGSSISIYRLMEPEPFERIRDYQRLLTRSLFASIINERFRELGRNPDAPFVSGGVGWNRFLRDTEIAVATLTVRDDRATEALGVIQRELLRAEAYGVSAAELDRARRRFFQSIDAALTNARTRSSESLADELVRFWTEGEAVPGIEEEHRLYQELLPDITRDEVNAVAKDFLGEQRRVILASLRSAPSGGLPSGRAVPTEGQLLEALRNAGTTSLERWQEEEQISLEALIPPVPNERTGLNGVVAQIEYPAIEATELLLSNGMRVVVKPTALREDEVLFSAFSPGGLAYVPDSEVTAATLAPVVAASSGIASLDATALEKLLSGRSVSLSTAIGRTTESMSGSARKDDLELLFQLIHLTFTAPRFEEAQFRNITGRMIQSIEGSLASPQGQFSRRFQEIFAAGDPRLMPASVEEIRAVDFDMLPRIFRERFSRPDDFVLIFVGSVDVEQLTQLSRRYLATIPGGSALESTPDRSGWSSWEATFPESYAPEKTVRYPRPEGVVAQVLRAGSEPVGQVAIVFHSPFQWGREENHRFNSLGDLLDIRLREEIRERAGGSYAVGAGGWRWRHPEPWSFMQVSFGMDPQRGDELLDITMAVVEELRTTVADDDYLTRIRAQQEESYRQSLQQNGYWLSSLEFYIQNGRNPETILTYPELIQSLTAEQLQETAKDYLDPARRLQLMLLPQ